MNKWNRKLEISEDNRPWFSFLTIIFVVIFGYIVFQFAGVLLIGQLFHISFTDFANMVQHPAGHPEIKQPIMVLQGISHLGGFILTPLFYLRFIEGRKISSITNLTPIPSAIVGITFMMVIFFMFFNALVIEWNQHIDFPGFMDGFEKWAFKNETELKELTLLITQFNSTQEFLFAFLIVAVLPAVGEELLFRGLLQNKLFAGTKNIHAAIWISAFIFGAVHMQFYGMVPRVLLGALFGYLYYWSGNIFVPMFAHFINNGFTLLALYLFQLKMVDYDLENTQSVPITTALFSGIATAFLIFVFWRFYKKQYVDTPDNNTLNN